MRSHARTLLSRLPPRACVRVYARVLVLVPPNLYLHTHYRVAWLLLEYWLPMSREPVLGLCFYVPVKPNPDTFVAMINEAISSFGIGWRPAWFMHLCMTSCEYSATCMFSHRESVSCAAALVDP